MTRPSHLPPGALPLPGDPPAPALDVGRRLAGGYVRRRAEALLDHAHVHSEWLRRHHRGWRAGRDRWTDLPPTHKRELMAAFDDWVTDEAVRLADVRAFVAEPSRIGEDFLGRYAVWTSSGTSGEPGLFLQDGQALAVYATLTALRVDRNHLWQHWARGAFAGLGRAALVAAVDGHYAGVSFWQRQCRLNPWLAARSRVLSVALPPAALCAELDAFAPAFLASYPSQLGELARLQAEGALHIAPAALWAGGEMLPPGLRAQIEQAFGAPVANDYGASECMSIACECPHGRLHVNDDWVILEPVDARWRPVPPGEASHTVLLTNLANRVQPIIRYDLGDSITVRAQPCECGSPRPAIEVQGRCNDTLAFRHADGREQRVSPMAITTAVEEQAGVTRFQLRQTAARTLELRLDAGAPRALRERCLGVLRAFLQGQGLHGIRVRFSAEAPERDARSGKLRQVACVSSH